MKHADFMVSVTVKLNLVPRVLFLGARLCEAIECFHYYLYRLVVCLFDPKQVQIRSDS